MPSPRVYQGGEGLIFTMNSAARRSDAFWSYLAYGSLLVAFLLSVLAVTVSYAAGVITRSLIYNSDSLYIPTLFKDLRASGNLARWDIPTNPYIFPDMFLYWVVDSVAGNLHLSIALFGLVQIGIFVFGLTILQAYLFGFQRETHGALLFSATLFMLFLSTEGQIPLIYPLVSVHHFGIILIIPYALVLVHRALYGSIRSRELVLLCVGLGLVSVAASSL